MGCTSIQLNDIKIELILLFKIALNIKYIYFKTLISNKQFKVTPTYGHALILNSLCSLGKQDMPAAKALRKATDENTARKDRSTNAAFGEPGSLTRKTSSFQ